MDGQSNDVWSNYVRLRDAYPLPVAELEGTEAERLFRLYDVPYILEECKKKEKQAVIMPTKEDMGNDSSNGFNDGGGCIICLENKAICVALPCGHLRYCAQCARNMCCGGGGQGGAEAHPKKIGQVQCAVCRQDVHEMKRCFL